MEDVAEGGGCSTGGGFDDFCTLCSSMTPDIASGWIAKLLKNVSYSVALSGTVCHEVWRALSPAKMRNGTCIVVALCIVRSGS